MAYESPLNALMESLPQFAMQYMQAKQAQQIREDDRDFQKSESDLDRRTKSRIADKDEQFRRDQLDVTKDAADAAAKYQQDSLDLQIAKNKTNSDLVGIQTQQLQGAINEAIWNFEKVDTPQEIKSFYGDNMPAKVTRSTLYKLLTNPSFTKQNTAGGQADELQLEALNLGGKYAKLSDDQFDLGTLTKEERVPQESIGDSFDLSIPTLPTKRWENNTVPDITGVMDLLGREEDIIQGWNEKFGVSDANLLTGQKLGAGKFNNLLVKAMANSLQDNPMKDDILKKLQKDIGTKDLYENLLQQLLINNQQSGQQMPGMLPPAEPRY